ncbi:hypothetical protein J5N97_014605 [Dioscorea zingiberensis]|uniref:Homeobox domain-containing protein n=1 Tax=Dioscorea zingiberensis TaxID=325984 RepID=A0A9D5CSS7_9LILI|nr:hypothetical protein J5N97_014605 [Dioscorea zingiberensis]
MDGTHHGHSQEQHTSNPSHGSNQQDRIPTEPVRSRWTPKPEQILILESIFNSGMVNPPKDETVRIRKLLEKFGAVGDANVFYWFQNRRSRSRRRQRQIQAGLAAAAGDPRAAGIVPRVAAAAAAAGSAMYHEPAASSNRSSSSSSSSSGGTFLPCTSATATSSSLIGDDSADDLFSISRQMGFMESSQNPMFSPLHVPQLHYQSGLITVFINGIPSEVPRGPIDARAMFGQDVMLVNSSGELVPVNEYGILYQGLQMGENYFMVTRTLCLSMKEGSSSSSVGREFKTSSTAYEDAKFVVSKLGLLWSSSERYEDCKLLEGVYRLLEEKEASLRELKDAFSVFDEDGDGLMNQRDLFRVMKKLGFEGVKVEECKKMIKVYDEDGDGCISFNEFRCMLESAT